MDQKPVVAATRRGPSQKTEQTSKPAAGDAKAKPKVHPNVLSAQVHDILSVLLVFRLINALCVRTFFQPDEYFQALEPAWSIAFGANSGAWLTWVLPLFCFLNGNSTNMHVNKEWQHQLRSSLHPVIFGLAYKVAYTLMTWMQLFTPFKAVILVALPGVVQSVFAALGDFYTWRLATQIYGVNSNVPWAAVCFFSSLYLRRC